MWDRGLDSYAMVQATVAKDCDYYDSAYRRLD